MIRKHLGFLALSLAPCACGEKSSANSHTSEPEKQKEAIFSGPLTVERLMNASGKVNSLHEWGESYEKLERFLGKPTFVDGKRYAWGAVDGDTCAYLYADREPASKYLAGQKGDVVGIYFMPMQVEKSVTNMNYDECLEMAGKK